jgi:hypothetical protein
MNTHLNLDKIQIASPCRARWQDMDGDDRARFCGQCRKHVYNFSAMTRAEVENLIREKEGKLCGRFYRRADGRMLTADCPTQARQRRNRLAKLGSALAAFLLSLTGGCMMGSIQDPKTTKIENPGKRTEPLMGDICVPQAGTNAPVTPNKVPK